MKTEAEVKSILDGITAAFNDRREKYRIYSQAFSYQEIEALEWVLGLNEDWGAIAALRKWQSK